MFNYLDCPSSFYGLPEWGSEGVLSIFLLDPQNDGIQHSRLKQHETNY